MRNEFIDECMPHFTTAAAIAGVVAALAGTYAQQKAASNARKAHRSALNAANGAAGISGPQATWAPTATQFSPDAGGGGARLGDVFSKPPDTPTGHATDQQQGFSLGVKSIGGEDTPPSQDFSGSFKIADQNQALPKDEMSTAPTQESDTGGSDVAGQAGQYAGLLSSLYGAYQSSHQKPQASPRPQLGPMNLQATANRWRT